MDKPAILQTRIHAYCFDTSKPDGMSAYAALCKSLSAQGLTCMESWGGASHYEMVKDLDGKTVDLETKHLFNNQWNTAPIPGHTDKGLRVFDWAQDYFPQGRQILKRGHYLEQTAEMKEVRRNNNKCGYCGHMEAAARGAVFCGECLDSEYLTEKDLHLTRMQSIDNDGPRAPLTDAEAAHLFPLYRGAQLHGSTERGKARLAKQRADIEREFQKDTRNAKAEHDGKIWLLDRGIKIDNPRRYLRIPVPV